MRFILGFIFFGLLFYAIYLYFPETFQTLVHWASQIFTFFTGFFEKISSKSETYKEAPKEAALILSYFVK